MSGRRRVNRDHPDCAEYTAKFHAIWSAYDELEKAEKAKYPEWIGLDHPANAVLCPVYQKCCRDTKELQKKYSHLFTEEVDNDN